ncbi:hypothetical protein E3N88_14555 [Mikania micrantha]|uniref:Uncharacterized protein n=1 Tax=Mikania micrantha TaxID=192012 RepID=A0A5N6P4U2_9ASTR|nr:hypothetical protein E3N88_14555 [Mikania micrantha]
MESEFDPILSGAHFFAARFFSFRQGFRVSDYVSSPADLVIVYARSRNGDFLNAIEVQVAGGEDRVQAVCSEENGWLFCAIYDGFNETIRVNLNSLDIELDYFINDGNTTRVLDSLQRALNQAENDFLYMVEQEMPDIVSVGSCWTHSREGFVYNEFSEHPDDPKTICAWKSERQIEGYSGFWSCLFEKGCMPGGDT